MIPFPPLSYLNSLTDKKPKIVELNGTIEDLMVEDEEILEGELDNAYIFENQIRKIEERLKNFFRLHTNSNMVAGSIEAAAFRVNKAKLPKITIKTFDGNPLNWKAFIECFKATVDNNVD